jgi:DNA-binding MarR family transcriptional regulator
VSVITALVKIRDNFQFPNWKLSDYNGSMQGQDIALLLKLAIQNEPNLPSKELAASLFISPSEVSKALKRCVDSGLLYISGSEKRVNRTALLEFLGHGLKYVFPPAKGSLVRGVPTAAAAEPLKSRLLDDGEPPTVWTYAEGKVRGISITPLYKGAPKAALHDSRFYGVLALSDAIRSGRTRERNLAIELLEKEIHG